MAFGYTNIYDNNDWKFKMTKTGIHKKLVDIEFCIKQIHEEIEYNNYTKVYDLLGEIYIIRNNIISMLGKLKTDENNKNA